jgi:hypothetical protein
MRNSQVKKATLIQAVYKVEKHFFNSLTALGIRIFWRKPTFIFGDSLGVKTLFHERSSFTVYQNRPGDNALYIHNVFTVHVISLAERF